MEENQRALQRLFNVVRFYHCLTARVRGGIACFLLGRRMVVYSVVDALGLYRQTIAVCTETFWNFYEITLQIMNWEEDVTVLRIAACHLTWLINSANSRDFLDVTKSALQTLATPVRASHTSRCSVEGSKVFSKAWGLSFRYAKFALAHYLSLEWIIGVRTPSVHFVLTYVSLIHSLTAARVCRVHEAQQIKILSDDLPGFSFWKVRSTSCNSNFQLLTAVQFLQLLAL